MTPFQQELSAGIPSTLPAAPVFDIEINRAPKRKDILSETDKKLAIRNALRYFPTEWHTDLATEFLQELNTYGRIYMYRFMPKEFISARAIAEYPGQSDQAKSIMLMIQNNLDPKVAQHPYELITYGGNGAVFQNWAQYSLVMKYLAEMTDDQTLVMYSGHPMGLFPSSKNAPRVVVTNGMMIPNYSKPDDWEKFNALGVTQYGQMTAGSFMYIGPQGIVHGTTITVLNAARMKRPNGDFKGLLFVTSGLGGMSGAQPKAAKIAGLVSVTAEVNPKAAYKRQEQGWVDIVIEDIDELVTEVELARKQGKDTSFAYLGNIVDVWEGFENAGATIDFGSDQTSLHNPFAGGYYPVGMSYEDANHMMAEQPERFKDEVYKTLRRHAEAINKQTKRGTYFFDYGNAFLLEAGRAGADVFKTNSKDFKYPSYVQDIMGPLCFDYGFGPFRWVCASGKSEDLDKTDSIAAEVIEQMLKEAPADIKPQLQDNLHWVKEAKKNKLVVGSQARILYADAEGRMRIAAAFNKAIRNGEIGAVVLGRDHHDVSGTDSPYRETSNIYDGSQFTADMAVQNFVGDAFRGATWVSLHNGGGVGWGEVINGGFGMLLDGSKEIDDKLKSMLFWDVNNGIARRNWARNPHAMTAIDRAMEAEPKLKVTKPNLVGDDVIDNLFTSP
jgi:urocanate hydratase